MAKRKKTRMGINQIKMQDTIITSEKEINESAINFFTSHFSGHIPSLEVPSLTLPVQVISEEQNTDLCRLPTLVEIKIVVFNLKTDSAPGSDGYTCKFYQACWEIIKFDLLEAILDFFSGNDIPMGFSHTQLALIPKIVSPQSWGDYRPISLCSNFQKILSKLLNDGFAFLLPNLISPNQSGFVQGRAIADNILLAQELAFAVDNKVRGSNVIERL